MPRVFLTPDYVDDRGTITDICGPTDGATVITTKDGEIRGNHAHLNTLQRSYVMIGRIEITNDGKEATILMPGDCWDDLPGQPHAWKSIGDSAVMVLTTGPRSGKSYESDTIRLFPPLISK